LSTSPISKLRAVDDERRQAKRNSLADKLTVEANALADLKTEKAAVEGEGRKVEADLGPVKYLATLLGAKDDDVLQYFILVVALLLDRPLRCYCWRRRGAKVEHVSAAREPGATWRARLAASGSWG
jgi:hypothetical protein